MRVVLRRALYLRTRYGIKLRDTIYIYTNEVWIKKKNFLCKFKIANIYSFMASYNLAIINFYESLKYTILLLYIVKVITKEKKKF